MSSREPRAAIASRAPLRANQTLRQRTKTHTVSSGGMRQPDQAQRSGAANMATAQGARLERFIRKMQSRVSKQQVHFLLAHKCRPLPVRHSSHRRPPCPPRYRVRPARMALPRPHRSIHPDHPLRCSKHSCPTCPTRCPVDHEDGFLLNPGPSRHTTLQVPRSSQSQLPRLPCRPQFHVVQERRLESRAKRSRHLKRESISAIGLCRPHISLSLSQRRKH